MLDEETINIIIAAVIPLFIGYLIERRYNIIERRHYVRIQFELEAKFFGPQKGNYIADLTMILNNKGLVRHKIDFLYLEVLGIEQDKEIELFKKKDGINPVPNSPDETDKTNIPQNKEKENESIKKKGVLNSIASFLDKILKTNMVQNKEKKIGLIEQDDKRKNRANFPVEIVKTNILQNKGTFFVEPGVVQRFSYVARIPEKIRFILVRSSFKYKERTKHSAQKMFEIKTYENNKVTERN